MLLLIQPRQKTPVSTTVSVRLNGVLDVLWRVVLKVAPEQFAHFGLPLLVVLVIGWIVGDGDAIHSEWGSQITLWAGFAVTLYLFVMSVRNTTRLARERRRRRAMKGN